MNRFLRLSDVAAAIVVVAAASASGSPAAGAECRPGPGATTVLRADVDGDGRRDVVHLVGSGARGACRFSLAVSTASRTVRATLRQRGADADWPLPAVPSLVRVARLGAGRAAHVLVAVDAGASTTAVAPYTLRAGRLVRLDVTRAPGFAGTFVLGGSLNASFAVDCLSRPRRVVQSVVSPDGARSSVRRSVYVLRPTGFALQSMHSYRLAPRDVPRRFPEFRDRRGPFGACGGS